MSRSNFHTHTTFCDGKNTAEEVVIAAMEKGFSAIGFSSHGYTPFDLRYCMKDTKAYIKEITRLKEKYKKDIEIYLGIEEEFLFPINRYDFDYMIGSSHYVFHGGKYYSIDSGIALFKECLELFSYDIEKFSTAYYGAFCDYILKRKPDIIGHFDIITKFDETDEEMRFLQNDKYIKIAQKATEKALLSGSIFEVNTGAISRGFRTQPYPQKDILYTIKKNDGKVMLSSDSHSAQTIDFGFEDAKKILKDVGFDSVYTIRKYEFVKEGLV